MRRLLAAFAVALTFVLPLSSGLAAAQSAVGREAATPAPTVRLGSKGQQVLAVQYVLRANGYVLAVDGKFGLQTNVAVRHFQRASGLDVDGIVGPATWSALTGPAPAVRVIVATAPPPVPVVAVPAAQWVTYDCESFRHLFDQVGLEWEFFGTVVMPRESHCDPGVYNGRNRDRSYGLMQINTYGSLWGEIRVLCNLTDQAELLDPLTNISCAKALFDKYGRRPWT